MAGINGLGNLEKSGVRPLRNTPGTRAGAKPSAQSFSVEDLKNGGSMNINPDAASPKPTAQNTENTQTEQAKRTIHERYMGRKTVRTSSRSQNSQLPVEEQIKKLGGMRKSAVEYESFFVDNLVKEMRQSPLAKTAGGETFSDIAEQPFRDFLSQAGGLGLADTIVGQLARQEGLEQTLSEHPEVMGPKWRFTTPGNLMKKTAGVLDIAPPAESIKEAASNEQAKLEETDHNPDDAARVGLMSAEEISWLYSDALESLA